MQEVSLHCFKSVSKLFETFKKSDGKTARFGRNREGEDREAVLRLAEQYKQYKTDFAQNIVFDSSLGGLSKI